MSKYVLFATERYALPIIQPLADALQADGHAVHAWWVDGAAGMPVPQGVTLIESAQQAVQLQPVAVMSAANWVPPFVSGAKVQLFHGFNVQKREDTRGHFRIRDLFDLYCTQGPATTQPFKALARKEGTFAVVETGWPKLDPLFQSINPQAAQFRLQARGRSVVMFGSTFTESLSAAPLLYEQIAAQVAKGDRYWLLTLHPKCPPELFEKYRALAGENACFVEPEDLVPAARAADVLVADTTSLVSEFIVQYKPVVTFRNRVPQAHMLNFEQPELLDAKLQEAFQPAEDYMAEVRAYADHIHPYRDGRSSQRVIAATTQLLQGELGKLKPKPLKSKLRELQIRKELGYWGSASPA